MSYYVSSPVSRLLTCSKTTSCCSSHNMNVLNENGLSVLGRAVLSPHDPEATCTQSNTNIYNSVCHNTEERTPESMNSFVLRPVTEIAMRDRTRLKAGLSIF